MFQSSRSIKYPLWLLVKIRYTYAKYKMLEDWVVEEKLKEYEHDPILDPYPQWISFSANPS
jgi:hypothetical protein